MIGQGDHAMYTIRHLPEIFLDRLGHHARATIRDSLVVKIEEA